MPPCDCVQVSRGSFQERKSSLVFIQVCIKCSCKKVENFRTMGVTCVEHRKAESPHDPQGLRLTVLFRILKDEHAAARKQKNVDFY